MAFIEIINNQGSVLIDDNYSNMSLVSKGQATLSAGVPRATVSVPSAVGLAPILAIRSSFLCAIESVSLSGGTYTFTVIGEQLSAGSVIDFYAFATPEVTPNKGGLVQIRNQYGQLVFDSNMQYSRVLGFKEPSESWADMPMPAGRVFAFAPIQPGFRSLSRNENPTPPPWRYVVTDDYFGYKVQGSVLVGARFISQIQTRSSNQALPDWAASYASPASGVIVLDVTNY